jgi:hypothetical protein
MVEQFDHSLLFQSCDVSILEEPWHPYDLPPLSFDSAELDIFDNQSQHQNLVLSNDPIFDYKDMINTFSDPKTFQVNQNIDLKMTRLLMITHYSKF